MPLLHYNRAGDCSHFCQKILPSCCCQRLQCGNAWCQSCLPPFALYAVAFTPAPFLLSLLLCNLVIVATDVSVLAAVVACLCHCHHSLFIYAAAIALTLPCHKPLAKPNLISLCCAAVAITSWLLLVTCCLLLVFCHLFFLVICRSSFILCCLPCQVIACCYAEEWIIIHLPIIIIVVPGTRYSDPTDLSTVVSYSLQPGYRIFLVELWIEGTFFICSPRTALQKKRYHMIDISALFDRDFLDLHLSKSMLHNSVQWLVDLDWNLSILSPTSAQLMARHSLRTIEFYWTIPD